MCAKEITKLLEASAKSGVGSDELVEAVYEELHRLAKLQFARQASGNTLQATALVNEAYARLFSGDSCGWENRRHFYAAAAEVMRHVLVDQARRKKAVKRGGDRIQLRLEDYDVQTPVRDERVLALNEALDRLNSLDPDAAELVKLRYFVRLTMKESAEAMGVSIRTGNRLWAFARAWLYQEIGE
jgi:RNA polymerase sigma factor (TIGR02999 family)